MPTSLASLRAAVRRRPFVFAAIALAVVFGATTWFFILRAVFSPSRSANDPREVTDLWAEMRRDRGKFQDRYDGKPVRVRGHVASWSVGGGNVVANMVHRPETERFEQNKVWVRFPERKPGEPGDGKYKNFDLRFDGYAFEAPWSHSRSPIVVRGTLHIQKNEEDSFFVDDATLE
jgi:hypothetical protein